MSARGAWLVIALLTACEGARVTRSGAAEDGTYTRGGDVDARTEAREELARDAWRREQRMLDVLEPGRALASMRLEDDEVAAGLIPAAELFAIGGELFHHRFLASEGGGATLARFEGTTAPTAHSCASCHTRGGAAGSGSSVDDAYEGGDGEHFGSTVSRRAPSLAGAAWIELVAREMTSELARLRDASVGLAHDRGADVTTRLTTHGVSFGSLVTHANGAFDTTLVEGLDADLVVRPFGAQGDHARLASMIEDELTRRLGLHVGDDAPALTEAQRVALTSYLALIAPPIEELPTTPDFTLAAARGREQFDALGCAGCHVPELTLASASYDAGLSVTLALAADGEPPRLPPRASDGALVVRAYSDLRRHAMGPALADARALGAVPADVFVTRPLWGLAATGPYLHDARAAGVEDAILAHGGEAQAARDAYAALDVTARGELRVFLATLTRARRLEVR